MANQRCQEWRTRRKAKHTKHLLCPVVEWPASSSLLALNWSVGLTITSRTDVSMAVISPIEGHAIGHPETTAVEMGGQPS